MHKSLAHINAAQLLGNLEVSGFIEDAVDTENFVLSRQQEKELPLYLRALAGVGAFIASGCFIGFLSAADIISYRQESGLIAWGLVFVAAAMLLQRLSGNLHDTVRHSFLMQSSFAAMAVGKSLFVFGTAQAMDSGWGATFALLTITAATYHVYRMSIDRFLSSLGVLISVLVNILHASYLPENIWQMAFNGFFLMQLAGTALLFTSGRIRSDYVPLAYAFAFSLAASALALAMSDSFAHWGRYGQEKHLLEPVFAALALAGGLIALIGWAAGDMRKLRSEPLMLASAGAMLLGTISAPGILLSIGFLTLGYARHERLMVSLGAVLLPVFLFFYYYNLHVSLMEKSAILIGSGVVLLAGRYYLKCKGWNKEGGTSCVQK